MSIPDNAPVLVGVGAIQQKETDITISKEPIALMIDAVNAALQDSQAPQLAADIECITVPKGMWSYSNPAALIADAIGAGKAKTEFCDFGILQQSNLGVACQRIAAGEMEVAMVVGGEAKYRQLLGHKQGIEVAETAQTDSVPDEFLQPETELWSEVESNAGLGMPVGYYALLESAICARRGLTMDTHRDAIASMYERFSEIGAANPDGWVDQAINADTIRNAGDKNKMLSFPYAKYHNSQWNVDQACALLFCSAGKARALGIPQSQWVFPLASTESNQILNVSQRPDLGHSVAAEIAGQRVLEIAGVSIGDIDFIELYSCFPAAVNLFVQALAIPENRDLTLTGAMPFGGGPLNNFQLQATVKMAQTLRGQPGSLGLVSCVSGMFTKQGYGVWSAGEYQQPFVFEDVSAQVAANEIAKPLVPPRNGDIDIIAATVLYEFGVAKRLVCVCEYESGERTVCFSEQAASIAAAEARNLVGEKAVIDASGNIQVNE